MILHNGCVKQATGGSAGALGWTVTVGDESVTAQADSASAIKAGSGILTVLRGPEESDTQGVLRECLSTLYFFDPDGNKLTVSWSLISPTIPTGASAISPEDVYYKYGNGTAISEGSFKILKTVLKDKIETNRKNGYIKEENPKVRHMPETTIDSFEQKYNDVVAELNEIKAEISSHEMAECNTKIEEMEMNLVDASNVIDDATEQLNTLPVLLEELDSLRNFASEADVIINDLEKWQLGKDRLGEMTSLAGDVYSDQDIESLSTMSTEAFETLKGSVNKIIDKIEASVPETPKTPEPSAEELEAIKMANLINSLENTRSDPSPDLLVRASRQKDDPLTTARSLVNRALKR